MYVLRFVWSYILFDMYIFFFSDDAFLRSTPHSSALDTLLQAVEQNNARLLAQVDSKLVRYSGVN